MLQNLLSSLKKPDYDKLLPSSWPDEFKEKFILTIESGDLTQRKREYLYSLGEAAGINPVEIDIAAERVERSANHSMLLSLLDDKADFDGLDDGIDDLDDVLPKDMEKYKGVLTALENGNITGAVVEFVKLLTPTLLVLLAAVVVCFFIKWWLGIISIFLALIILAGIVWREYSKFQNMI